MADDRVRRAADLRQKLMAFTLKNYWEEYEKSHRERFPRFDPPKRPIPEKPWQDFMEAFVFQRDPRQGSILEAFEQSRSSLGKVEKKFLKLWRRLPDGFFRIEADEDGRIAAFSLVNERRYAFVPGVEPPLGSYMVCRLFPVGADEHLPGTASVVPKEDPTKVEGVLITALGVQALSAERALADNAEKFERSRQLSESRYAHFMERFEADEVVGGHEKILEAFRDFGLGWRKIEPAPALYPDTDLAVTASLAGAEDLGLVMDPREGLGLVKDYQAFMKMCETGNVPEDRIPVMAAYVAQALTVPIVWDRALRRHPESTRTAVAKVVDEDKLDAFFVLLGHRLSVMGSFPASRALLDDQLASALPAYLERAAKQTAR